jgi:LCP family protein required for cell wall assembly
LANNQRVNFLLLGSDTDLKFASDAYLTQSIIVVSVDPVAKTVSMLSIPRDLWVYIPGYGAGKIQIAYEVGGIDLIRTTVEQDFGIPIHYYAWVGLQGFQKLIDTVGGVTMDVSHPVLDDAYPDDLNASDPYAYMRLLQPAGPQHLTGVEALQFVRSRHGDLVGDFGRSSRQQALLLALKQRLLQPDMLLHLPQLTGDLEGNVRTDVPASDFLQYAGFARTLKATDIRQVVLQPPVYSDNSVTADGKQDIVIPHWQAIDQIVTQLFKTQPRPSIADRNAANVAQAAPVATATPRESQHSAVAGTTPVATVRPVATDTPLPPSSDQLAVLVENDTTVSGLAQKATTYLQTQGYRVLAPVTGKPGLTHTAVNFYIPEARAQALNIARLLGASVNDQSRTGSSSTTIIVVLGKDAVSKFS